MDVEALARLPTAGAGKSRDALEQVLESDPRLESGQRRADAEVDAVAERDVRVRVAA